MDEGGVTVRRSVVALLGLWRGEKSVLLLTSLFIPVEALTYQWVLVRAPVLPASYLDPSSIKGAVPFVFTVLY